MSLSAQSGGVLCHEEIDQVPRGWGLEQEGQPVSAQDTRQPDMPTGCPAEAHSAAAAGVVEAIGTGITPQDLPAGNARLQVGTR
jgi:hypothetical protein